MTVLRLGSRERDLQRAAEWGPMGVYADSRRSTVGGHQFTARSGHPDSEPLEPELLAPLEPFVTLP